MHPRHNMNLGALGQTGKQEDSRISAILTTNSGGGVAGANVKLFDASTGNLVEARSTNTAGQVAFKLAFSNQAYVVQPEPPEGYIINPSERKVRSIPASSWSIEKSLPFLVTKDLGESRGLNFSMPPFWVLALVGVGIWFAWPIIEGTIDRVINRE